MVHISVLNLCVYQVIYVNQTMAVMTVSYNEGYLACSYGEFICVYKIGMLFIINQLVSIWHPIVDKECELR